MMQHCEWSEAQWIPTRSLEATVAGGCEGATGSVSARRDGNRRQRRADCQVVEELRSMRSEGLCSSYCHVDDDAHEEAVSHVSVMADSAVKEWLLLNTPVTVNKKEVLLPDYEDVDSSEGSV